ncbi:hypothetical protein NM208_g3856 [Fusarium decemcellulare]|uniref:Uncharacterized protein n=1 Tax=Fusarium decemcellulare TaxID=57161 RepID=A0ACC1SMZ9_9HYPO|nr:hypothetical protein NM208_g3856 [Fusarium decemcellulare]
MLNVSLPAGPPLSLWTDVVLKYHWLNGTRAKYVHRLHQCYGPVVRLGPNEVDISQITAVKEIHSVKGGYKKSQFYERLVPGTINIFSTTDTEFHRRHRRILSSPLSESSIKTVEVAVDLKVKLAISKMADEMAERQVTDVAKFWLFMATDIISELSFGESFGMLEAGKKNQYIEDLEGLAARGPILTTFPTLIAIARQLPIPFVRRPAAAAARLRAYSQQAVLQYKRDFASNPAADKPMLFRKLFKAGEDGLSDEEIRAEAQAYIVAGSDTTATTLTYLIWSVCRNTKVKETLVSELERLSHPFSDSDLRSLPYLNAVIDETLRLYAAAPSALPRVVPRGGSTLAGHYIPEDTIVSTQAWTLHRDPLVFPRPEQYDPSRWLAETKEMRDAMMPFGGGARACIGKHLARMELRLGAARFFRAFPSAIVSKKEGMSDKDMEPKVFFLLAPKGGRCLVEPSESSLL